MACVHKNTAWVPIGDEERELCTGCGEFIMAAYSKSDNKSKKKGSDKKEMVKPDVAKEFAAKMPKSRRLPNTVKRGRK